MVRKGQKLTGRKDGAYYGAINMKEVGAMAKAGKTWTEIGKAFGMSPTGIRKKYDRSVKNKGKPVKEKKSQKCRTCGKRKLIDHFNKVGGKAYNPHCKKCMGAKIQQSHKNGANKQSAIVEKANAALQVANAAKPHERVIADTIAQLAQMGQNVQEIRVLADGRIEVVSKTIIGE